jgi:diaminohydroxyphosphoribosylaminopyrimidine deaminase/5-amino-6-(5-phosphoribosylamino)uracil reductase
MTLTPKDVQFLSRSLQLAQSGIGLVSPGALVGAVVVKNGRVVGEGFFRYDKRKHAEVSAIEKAGKRARGATLYLNLEPCSHFGRTPPCDDFVVVSGIRRVVCAMRDPNPLVAGKGFRKLRAAGIQVDIGGLEFEAKQLNDAFIKFITTRVPFVTLKTAMTLDARIASADHKRGSVTWITSELSRQRAHEIRHSHDAILVGKNTILMDDPVLTDRSNRPRRRPLLRVVLDTRLRTPLTSQLVRSANQDVLIFCGPEVTVKKRAAFERRGVQIAAWSDSRLPKSQDSSSNRWKAILRELARREIQSLLIEGGAEVNWTAVEAGIVDKFCFFIAPKILGGFGSVHVFGGRGGALLEEALQLCHTSVERIGDDVMITGYSLPLG